MRAEMKLALLLMLIFSMNATTDYCTEGSECEDTVPICKIAEHKCVQCLNDPDCAANTNKHCETTGNTCVECTDSAHCTTAPYTTCDQNSHMCISPITEGSSWLVISLFALLSIVLVL